MKRVGNEEESPPCPHPGLGGPTPAACFTMPLPSTPVDVVIASERAPPLGLERGNRLGESVHV